MEKSHYKSNGAPPLPGGVAAQAAPKSDRYWDDEEFQDQLTYLLVHDRDALEQCIEAALDPEDFRTIHGMHSAMQRMLVVERALEHYAKRGEPLGKLLRADALDYAAQINMGVEQIRALREYVEVISKLKPASPAFIIEKVLAFKSQHRKAAAIQELMDLQDAGALTDERWQEISQRVSTASATQGTEAPQAAQWPEPLGPEAYHGLAGDVIRAIEPNTESDVAALLVQFLLAFGNVIGRHAHWKVEATNHYLNLFAVLVGQTSKARKGTSLDRVLDLFEDVDGDWLRDRRMSGLSTGEGLISEVKDPILKRNKDGEMVETEEGVADKRLLVTEPEFARVLKVGEREAATLPSILRDAWDRGELRTMTKNSPLHATGAHITMIAHITEGELKRTLSDTNRSNGFANRFLWVCVRRSKALPLGGDSLASETREKLVERIRDAVRHATMTRRMGLGSRATPLWKKLYPQLSEGLPGMLGAATDRSEAQVRRLACLYALLDGERYVREEHLRAALEVWRYCLDSARFLFGESLGDPIAETILKELRRRGSGGITRNEIRKGLFGQNKSSEAIGHALESLQSGGRARRQVVPGEGAGRPTEHWYAV